MRTHPRLMALIVLLGSLALGGLHEPACGQDAPLFTRSFDGVPIPLNSPFLRIVPLEQINSGNDDQRQLDPGGGPESLPADLPPRFTDITTTPSTTGMTAGMSYFGQFVDHDLTLTRTVLDSFLLEPFVFSYGLVAGDFQNRRTPGFDLDSLYRIHPFNYPSTPDTLGPWDASNLRFRLLRGNNGALDFFRGPGGQAIIGDGRNDENGVIAHIHRAFMKLHNVQVDKIIEREGIDESTVELGDPVWWNIFNEARNYTTAYYQGIVANEFSAQITGRTLFDAMDATVQPLGPLSAPHAMLEFAECAYRLHTLTPVQLQVGESLFVTPIDTQLRGRVPWKYLFGPTALPAGKLDLAVAEPLRAIVNLFIPGNPVVITLDLAQVNILRGREVTLPSGEEYLVFLLNELGLDPPSTSTVRGKVILTPANAATILDPVDDADLLADVEAGDTDLWAYVLLEAELNGGLLGPVGQDIIERTFAGLYLADDWSLVGALGDQFTPEQMKFFRTATFDRLLSEILLPSDVNQDNFVDVLDLIAVLLAFGESDSPADVDGDGIVSILDLMEVIEDFGTF